MITKFKIVFDDGTFLESHDPNWNQVKDHCHALPPFSNKKWKRYELITDDGQFVWVDFQTGVFCINGQIIHPATRDGIPLTHLTDLQDFESAKEREILNHMPYYPVFGKTHILGDWGHTEIRFCGWKRKYGERTIQKVVYLYPSGQIVFT